MGLIEHLIHSILILVVFTIIEVIFRGTWALLKSQTWLHVVVNGLVSDWFLYMLLSRFRVIIVTLKFLSVVSVCYLCATQGCEFFFTSFQQDWELSVTGSFVSMVLVCFLCATYRTDSYIVTYIVTMLIQLVRSLVGLRRFVFFSFYMLLIRLLVIVVIVVDQWCRVRWGNLQMKIGKVEVFIKLTSKLNRLSGSIKMPTL